MRSVQSGINRRNINTIFMCPYYHAALSSNMVEDEYDNIELIKRELDTISVKQNSAVY